MSMQTNVSCGYGFSIENVTEEALAAFILNHRDVFSKTEKEKEACNFAEITADKKAVEDELFFYLDDYEDDNSGYTGFGAAISNIMTRETGIGFTYKKIQACLYCIKGKTFDMPVYYDVEEWSQAYLSKTELTNLIDGFCNKLEDSGFKAGVYATNGMYWNIDKTTLKKKYSMWLAQLNGDFTGITDDVHQYTWTEKVSGITTNVDCNYIYNLNIIS